jgi:DNA-binding transcriptional MerR regulator
MYRIGEFSRLTQVPVKTLRHYDAIGLLRPAHVDPSSSYRYYTAAEVERLNRILVFRDLGFALLEIRALVAENVPPGQIRGILRLKCVELERSVDRERARLQRAAERLELLERSGDTAAHAVAVRETAPQLVASVRARLRSYDECERLFDELAHAVGPQRRRGALWHECAEGAVDCEAFVLLPASVPVSGRVRVHELPAQRVASLVYRGDTEFLPAYRAMRTWLSVSGASLSGPKRELFLAEAGGASPSVTEVQFPIAAAGPRAREVPPA